GPACLAANDGRTYTVTETNCIWFDDGGPGGGGGGGGPPDPGDGFDNSPLGDDVTLKLKNFVKYSLTLPNQRQHFYDATDTFRQQMAVFLDAHDFSAQAKILANWMVDLNHRLNYSMGHTELTYLIENPYRAGEINDFLDGENDSPGAVGFATQAIKALAEGAEVDFENGIIFSSSVPDCAKNIIKDLIADKTFLDLGDMPDIIKQELNLSGFILDLFNHSDKFKLVFKSESLTQTTPSGTIYKNASTNPKMDISNPGKFIFTITLDSSFIENATDLAIARTIIHETVHSYISYQYQEDVFSSFSQAYAKLLGSVNNNPNSAQHRIMATDFVHAISNS